MDRIKFHHCVPRKVIWVYPVLEGQSSPLENAVWLLCSEIELFHDIELKGEGVSRAESQHSFWLLFCKIPNTSASRINYPISGARVHC